MGLIIFKMVFPQLCRMYHHRLIKTRENIENKKKKISTTQFNEISIFIKSKENKVYGHIERKIFWYHPFVY